MEAEGRCVCSLQRTRWTSARLPPRPFVAALGVSLAPERIGQATGGAARIKRARLPRVPKKGGGKAMQLQTHRLQVIGAHRLHRDAAEAVQEGAGEALSAAALAQRVLRGKDSERGRADEHLRSRRARQSGALCRTKRRGVLRGKRRKAAASYVPMLFRHRVGQALTRPQLANLLSMIP